MDLDYLKLLSKQFPNIPSASTEIINLSAILNLPKGTEHFVSDIHGEHESFIHVLKNGSGVIKRRIDEIFSMELSSKERRSLATLIYYPKQKLKIMLNDIEDKDEWLKQTLFRLVKIARIFSSKYTRSKIRKTLPKDFAYIIEELIHENEDVKNKHHYYNAIIDTIIKINRAKQFIIAISEVIQKLAVDRLHIIGDIFDRGPGAHIILDKLKELTHVDIQWGNHDILWMGAASGSKACIANVIRISLRYSNLNTLENGYGITLLPLASFALQTYENDSCREFLPKKSDETDFSEYEANLIAKMHKAITIIQFKLEARIIKRRPHYEMEDRLLLHKIDKKSGTIEILGKKYKLKDSNFPTIDEKNPYELTKEELNVINKLKEAFTNSTKLEEHIRFLYANGSMYLKSNNNLLYHGCIPMNEDKSFTTLNLDGKDFTTKSFFDRIERLSRQGYFSLEGSKEKEYGQDAMWYLWCGKNSPLFGKSKMATFERYFIDDKKLHKENKNPYYHFRDSEEVCTKILNEFGLDSEKSRIINGHVPVEVKKGESPIKANGKLFVIDGGFSKAYQSKTGIAGYTLIANSYGFLLSAHEPFESTRKAIESELDLHSTTKIVETSKERQRVKDTDLGKRIKQKIETLKELLNAFSQGFIKENF